MSLYDRETAPLLSSNGAIHSSNVSHKNLSESTLNRENAVLPVLLTWEDIYYTIPKRKSLFSLCASKDPKVPTEKVILNHISGVLKPGQSLAIIGSTGSGKTSLLDILAAKAKSGVLTGELLVNGKPPDASYKRISGYVTQDDCLMGSQTVFETLLFIAQLKLPSVISYQEKIRRVEKVIDELGLHKVRNSIIGTSTDRGISGGEKKRVSIGVELITDPSLIFLDEPTTGLDSYNAYSVMKNIQSLRERGRTVVFTIHQPRSAIFEKFDLLLILSRGSVVYYGPAPQAVQYFSSLNFVISQFNNPGDYLIDIVIKQEKKIDKALNKLEIDVRPKKYKEIEEERGDIEEGYLAKTPSDLSEAYRNSTIYNTVLNDIKSTSISENQDSQKFLYNANPINEYATSVLHQTYYISKREISNLKRDPRQSYALVAQFIFFGVIVGSIFFLINDDQTGIQNRSGALFFILTNAAFSQMPTLITFLEQRTIFNRERSSGVYRSICMFLAKACIPSPFQNLILPIFGLVIMYWMVGFQSDLEKFGIFLGVCSLVGLVAGSMLSFVGSIAPNVQIGTMLGPMSIVILFLFGGFFINGTNIPVYYVWIKYISFFKYGYEILMYNEFRGLTFTCTPSQETNGICPIPTGEVELDLLGMQDVVIWHNVAILAAMFIVYRILGYLAFRTLHKEKR